MNRFLLTCGIIGCSLFITIFLTESFLRVDYSPVRFPVSSISIGERDTKKLNKTIWEMYRNHDLKEIRRLLDDTHTRIQTIISKHTEKQLFEKKQYAWTGSSSLATYIRVNTSSHYTWAYKLIRKAKKNK